MDKMSTTPNMRRYASNRVVVGKKVLKGAAAAAAIARAKRARARATKTKQYA